jgi:ribose 5-phosphate isomerase B
MAVMKIFIGADHGGFKLKGELVNKLIEGGYEVIDAGAFELDVEDSFVEYAVTVVEEMQNNPDSRGLLICRNGVGMSIVANRFDGIRCGLGFNSLQVEKARTDDDINVLAIPADYMPTSQAFEMVETFLTTEFSDEDKYALRLEEIEDLTADEGCCGGECGGDCDGNCGEGGKC